MAVMKSYIGRRCCTLNSFVKNLLISPSDNASLKCYEWEYTMTDPGDTLQSISLDDPDGNTIHIVLNEPLSDSEFQIYTNIINGFNSNSIPFEAIDVEKTSLGGGLFTILITLYGISYTNLIADASGNVSSFIERACDAGYLQDNNGSNILDSLNAPLITI